MALQPQAELRNGDVGPAVVFPARLRAALHAPKTGVALLHARGLWHAIAQGPKVTACATCQH